MKRLLLIAAAALSVSGLQASERQGGSDSDQPRFARGSQGAEEVGFYSDSLSGDDLPLESGRVKGRRPQPAGRRGSNEGQIPFSVEPSVDSADLQRNDDTSASAREQLSRIGADPGLRAHEVVTPSLRLSGLRAGLSKVGQSMKRHFMADDWARAWSAYGQQQHQLMQAQQETLQRLRSSGEIFDPSNSRVDDDISETLTDALGGVTRLSKPFLTPKAMTGARIAAPFVRAGMWGVAAQQALDKKSWLAKKVEAIKNVHLRRIARLSPLALAAFLDYLMARGTGQYAVADAVIAPVKKAKKLFSKSTNDINTVKPGIERSSSLSSNDSHSVVDAVRVAAVV